MGITTLFITAAMTTATLYNMHLPHSVPRRPRPLPVFAHSCPAVAFSYGGQAAEARPPIMRIQLQTSKDDAQATPITDEVATRMQLIKKTANPTPHPNLSPNKSTEPPSCMPGAVCCTTATNCCTCLSIMTCLPCIIIASPFFACGMCETCKHKCRNLCART